MAENQVDGGQPQGTEPVANSSPSEPGGVQQPSFDAAKLQSTLDAFKEGMETLAKRVDGLQGVKDKQANELTGLKGKIAEYEQLKEKLGSSESAMEQLELRDTLARMNKQLEQLTGSSSTQPTGTGTSGAVNVAKAFAEAGFSEEQLKNPRVSVALQQTYQSNDMASLAAYRLKQQLASSPSPTEAQGASLQGKPQANDVAAKTQEYINNVKAARGKPTEIKRLREQAIKDGVKTWEIDFG